MEGAAFCPYCGEKVAQADPGTERPLYEAEVKRAFRAGGRLLVYHDRTEFIASSVQKSVFPYTGLVAVKKGFGNAIDFIMEDGRTESCALDGKCVHEAFVHIEQAVRPYLAQRSEELLARGIRYSFPSSQGPMSGGVLDLSGEQAEFKAKSGKGVIIPYRDVRSVSGSADSLVFSLYGGVSRSFSVSKELRDEVVAFVNDAIAPYLAQRREELLARGIYFSSMSPDGRTLNVLADRVEYTDRSGQVDTVVAYPIVRAVSLYAQTLELALTDGTAKSFPIEEAVAYEALEFIKQAIEPYVTARTAGFDAAFGKEERIEFNGERSVFHILRQGGREITDEWPLEALVRCEWTEDKKLTALGSVVSGGIDLFKSATKAGGQADTEPEEKLGSVDVVLTIRTGQGEQTQGVCFGRSPVGMTRSDKKFTQCLSEWADLADYLSQHCPACERIDPVLPEPEPLPTETDALPDLPDPEATPQPEEAPAAVETAPRRDDLGISKYLEGVSRFIGSCATPMTIAFQGNRGSGKNNILRMLSEYLEGQYGSCLLWLNAWEFPQAESGGALAVLAGKTLVEALNSEGDGSSEAKDRAASIASGFIRLFTGFLSQGEEAGNDFVDALFRRKQAETISQMVRLFAAQSQAKATAGAGKVIFLIDGLNQLDPAKAVELLEALREFFSCEGCVFVVAADYDNILRGARQRYDEGRAKDFFDEIFKAAFQVPQSSYNLLSYMEGKLADIGVRAEDEAELACYTALAQTSVGRDTETIDRLLVSFQLLQAMTAEDVFASRYKRLVLFALLCMQKAFRSVYDYAVRCKDRVTPEFLAGLCTGADSLWGAKGADSEEQAAYRSFGEVLSQVVNLDDERAISEGECRAFAEVLELSSVTYR